MSDSLFEEGGPHRIRRTARDHYEMSVSLPPGEDGMLARECDVDACSPAYFKVRPGTGITEAVMYCPYCRTASDPSHFHTREQIRYAQDLAKDEARKGVDRMFRKALGLGSSPRKKLVDGPISVELEYTPGQRPRVARVRVGSVRTSHGAEAQTGARRQPDCQRSDGYEPANAHHEPLHCRPDVVANRHQEI